MGRGKAAKSLALVDAAKAILERIQPTTVRSVCYQLFVAGVIMSMKKSETDKVGVQLKWARETGIIPWSWIVDETRKAEHVSAWENPTEYARCVQQSYRRDRWATQPKWVEVWSEKGTIRGILAPVLNAYGVTFRVMHGYGSTTAVHDIAIETEIAARPLLVLYVGDWDPSGMHMSTMDLPQRLVRYGGNADIVRLALTAEDVADPNLPSFPASDKGPKPGSKGDPRYPWYVERYGRRCWELDAMNPVTLRGRVRQAIVDRIEQDAWDRADVAEAAELESLRDILSLWPGRAFAESISRQASKYEGGS